tara:strand:+ start:41 stop:538 length:498 start_codon:yes stop_codon:yes gene_type:complete
MTKGKNYKKNSKRKYFLRKKINIIESYSISTIQAKIIFWMFSILLVFDLLILPIIFGYKNESYDCKYGAPICLTLTLIPLLIFGFFWIMIWRKIFIIFYMSKEDKDKKRNSKFFLTKLGMKNMDYLESMTPYKVQLRFSIIAISALMSILILWLFVYQIFRFTIS